MRQAISEEFGDKTFFVQIGERCYYWRVKLILSMSLTLLMATSASADESKSGEWKSLFDGKTLNGWKQSEEGTSFSVADGAIMAKGDPKGHLYYDGEVNNHNFRNFILELEVKTLPGANGGVYFHTEYQKGGWPEKGFEAQVNATQGDWKKSGGLYNVSDVRRSPVPDNEWWKYTIEVRGRRVVMKINDEVTTDWTQPQDFHLKAHPGRKLSSGTIAFQAHDPKSICYFRNIRIKPLADEWVSLFDGTSLEGWKQSEEGTSFSIVDGAIMAKGDPKGHLYYNGNFHFNEFKNFEFKVDVLTRKGANGGVYFHTQYQPGGWPAQGFEAQVNATQGDWKKGGSLYNVVNVREAPVGDDKWWTYHIKVKDNRVILKVDGKTTVDWVQPEGYNLKGNPGRKIGSGTFAFQAHDPKSICFFKNVMVKVTD